MEKEYKCSCGNMVTEQNKVCHEQCNAPVNKCCAVFLADIRNKLSPVLFALDLANEKKAVPDKILNQAFESIDYIKNIA